MPLRHLRVSVYDCLSQKFGFLSMRSWNVCLCNSQHYLFPKQYCTGVENETRGVA